MKERSLVVFTVLAQTAVGLYWAWALVWWAAAPASGTAVREQLLTPLVAVGPFIATAALASLLHLGSPAKAWRALGNLRTSWLSREVLFVALFAGGWGVLAATVWLGDAPPAAFGTPDWMGGAAGAAPLAGLMTALLAVVGAGLVYSMARVYRLRTVPGWDTPLTSVTFFLTALSLGALAATLAISGAVGGEGAMDPAAVDTALDAGVAAGGGAEMAAAAMVAGQAVVALAGRVLLLVAGLALALELWLEVMWVARRRAAARGVDPGLNPPGDPAAAGEPGGDVGRRTLLVIALALIVAAQLSAGLAASRPPPDLLVGLALAAALVASVLGRARFYRGHARAGL
jgi:anaerobic dimethyl sulfoxide reductase subunit C